MSKYVKLEDVLKCLDCNECEDLGTLLKVKNKIHILQTYDMPEDKSCKNCDNQNCSPYCPEGKSCRYYSPKKTILELIR